MESRVNNRGLAWALGLGTAGLLTLTTPSSAQLSPGELSAAHAELEGSSKCLECHQSRQGVDPALCLDCHEPLLQRIRADRGLHAGEGYVECERCHIEHHGRDFELIWWGEQGMTVFDHTQTGHVLEGAHRELDCRSCHRPDLVEAGPELVRAGKDLAHTFLGLDSACRSCHLDSQHHGQFEDRACTRCHDQQQWTGASLFDHARTSFPLQGRHRSLGCEECHGQTTLAEAGETSVRYRGVAAASCRDCHEDPHAGRLGARCESCHRENGWHQTIPGFFKHRLTRFALVGRHLDLGCDSCHAPGRALQIPAFSRCDGCHQDAHRGELVDRGDGGACEACHDELGFRPALFSIADHDATAFPLTGAHLATACDSCHRGTLLDSSPPAPGTAATGVQPAENDLHLRLEATSCESCHSSPHGGSLRDSTPECSFCHRVETWKSVGFDHSQTPFPLRGAHSQTTCTRCHAAGGREAPLPLAGIAADCSACHFDQHLSQFDRGTEVADCSDCHSEITWLETAFDHDHDSGFALEGAHAGVACNGCHPAETAAGEVFVRYRPLASACEDCHGVASGK